jgi:DNA-binding PadR family transcriptional regulator
VVTGAVFDVLELLLRAWEDDTEVSGWTVMKSIRRSGPTVYRVLDRLEDVGWITGSWETLPAGDSGPRRRLYRITGAGAEAARAASTVPVEVPRRRLQPGFGRVAGMSAGCAGS